MKRNGIEYDDKLFTEVKQHSQELMTLYRQRDLDFDDYENAFLLERSKSMKKNSRQLKHRMTQSPDARTDVQGAVRLLISTAPKFNIVNMDDMEKKSGQLETSLDRVWDQSGRVAGMPVQHDILTSAVLYGEMHNAVTLTSDLVKSAEKAATRSEGSNLAYAKAQVARMEYLYEHTPGMIESWNPHTGYPEMDNFGFLTAYYRQTTVRHADIIRRFGITLPDANRLGVTAPVVLESYWDDVYTWYWVGGTVLGFGEHKLPRIPISVQLADGSRLFSKPEHQRQPLLYSFIKSGFYDNQSLALSIIYNLVFTMGATPVIKHKQGVSRKKADSIINYGVDGGAWELEPDEDIEFLRREVITPDLREAMALATQKGQESTIYPQAFGAPVQGNDTYSALALLNSSGRLPLIGPQKQGSWGISNTIELLFMMMREAGESYKRNGIDITLEDIPRHVQVETKLEVDLPQDKLQMANMASMFKREGLASDEWIQTNLMQINDTAAMRKQIWREKVRDALYAVRTEENIAKLRARSNPNPAAGGAPNAEQLTPPGVQPKGEPMNVTAGPMMPEGGETLQGMPQVMAGMMPGAGRAVAPPQGQANGKPPKARR